MSLFGRWSELHRFDSLDAARNHFNVGDELWQAFTNIVGNFQDDLRLLSAFPRTGLLSGLGQAVLPDGRALTPVQATQIGLVWRLSRRVMAFQTGATEAEFQDIDPWQESTPSDTSRQNSTSSGVKEKVLKMAALIDQSDDSELLPPAAGEVTAWLQKYHAVMGAMPEESEEPSPNQLAALHKRVYKDDAPAYVDFGVFGPFERKLTKIQRCRIYTPLGDGTYLQRDLPGPPTYQGWLASWRVLKTACIMLDIASLASLEVYGKHIERLVTQWPSAWGLIYSAEDAARAERMAKAATTLHCGSKPWSPSSTRLECTSTLELPVHTTCPGRHLLGRKGTCASLSLGCIRSKRTTGGSHRSSREGSCSWTSRHGSSRWW